MVPKLTAAALFGLAATLSASPPDRAGRAQGTPARNAVANAPARFILATGKEPATADKVTESKAPLTLRPNQFLLSGGPKPSDAIVIDDDLEILVDDRPVFVDKDHVSSADDRGGIERRYTGLPILVSLPPNSRLRIRATDHCATEAKMGSLYLHGSDGVHLLAEAVKEDSKGNLPHTFFDATYLVHGGASKPVLIQALAGVPSSNAILASVREQAPPKSIVIKVNKPADLEARLKDLEAQLVEVRKLLEEMKARERQTVVR